MNLEISDTQYVKLLNWYDAKLYCELLEIDGKNDWRLPTIEEMISISVSNHDFEQMWYWTGTEADEEFEDYRKMQYNVYDNGFYYAAEDDKSKCYTRPVRSC
jgi:hypothetical protein